MSEYTKPVVKTQWTKRIAQMHLEAQQKSGLSKPVFCEQSGIDYKKFLTWSRRLSLESEKTSAPIQFLPVSIKSDHQAMTASVEVIAKDGHVVRVGSKFDSATLRHVLRALEEPC